MRILMATDGSKRAAAALEGAARMLSADNREADLMCVVPSPRAPGHSRQQSLRRRAGRALERIQPILSDTGITARPIVETGSVTRTLIEAARRYDVAVIAATSHRSGPMAGLGPVASRLAEHSSGTTLVARENQRNGSGVRVLAAVDGSEGSIRALDAMTGLIDLTAAEVTLLHVAETPWLSNDSDREWPASEDDDGGPNQPEAQLEQELVLKADEILENARQRLPARITVNTLVYEGLPADEILGEAERGEYDLVVIGASGATDMKHAMLGSVSSKVAWNAPCSVLLVHAADWQ